MVHFRLDRQSHVPFYRQIIDLTLSAISAGTLLPGEKLPTIRDMAVKLELNPNTIAKAYSQLQLLGVLDTQQGSGVFVSAHPSASVSEEDKQRVLEALCNDFVSRAQLLNIHVDELVEFLQKIRGKS